MISAPTTFDIMKLNSFYLTRYLPDLSIIGVFGQMHYVTKYRRVIDYYISDEIRLLAPCDKGSGRAISIHSKRYENYNTKLEKMSHSFLECFVLYAKL